MDREYRTRIRKARVNEDDVRQKKKPIGSTAYTVGGIILAAVIAASIVGAILGRTTATETPAERPASRHPSWVVSLQIMTTYGPAHICTGVLVRRDVALTAAHCIIKPPADVEADHDTNAEKCRRRATPISTASISTASSAKQYHAVPEPRPGHFLVRVGSATVNHGGELIDVRTTIAEPRFTFRGNGFTSPSRDIGVLILARPATQATPISLAPNIPASGQAGSGLGWDVHDNDGCGDIGPELQEVDGQVDGGTVCLKGIDVRCLDARGHGLCEGASGGPVVSPDGHGGDMLIGVFVESPRGQCLAGPSGFTPVALFREFIDTQLRLSSA